MIDTTYTWVAQCPACGETVEWRVFVNPIDQEATFPNRGTCDV